MLPEKVHSTEVGPREGFQFEGIDQPDKISTRDKISVIEARAETGSKRSSVFPLGTQQVSQMADAEQIMAVSPFGREYVTLGSS
jgi:hydroxymethylglutaryl-CoA lyase